MSNNFTMDDYYSSIDDDFLLPLLDTDGDADVYSSAESYYVAPTKEDHPRAHLKEEHEASTGTANGRGTKKRKRDFVQGLVDKCNRLEEENAMMRVAIQNSQMSFQQLEQKRDEKLKVLKDVIEAFNEGDISKVSSVIKKTFSSNCVLITPSIFQELNGYFAIVKFFTVLIEAFPDALLQIVEPKGEHNGVVSAKFNFSGTKVFGLPTDVLFRQWSSTQPDNTNKMKTEAINSANSATPKPLNGIVVTGNMNPYAVMEATNAHNEELRSKNGTGASNSDSSKQPVVKLSGHIAIAFDSMGLISRFIFVWNTTSLIGQVFGHSSESLASMSEFFANSLNQFKGFGQSSQSNSNNHAKSGSK